jgi:hypothetical protein
LIRGREVEYRSNLWEEISLEAFTIRQGGGAPKGEQAKSCHHCNAAVSADASLVYVSQSREDVVYVGTSLAEFVEGIGKDVKAVQVPILVYSQQGFLLSDLTYTSSESEAVLTWRRASWSRNRATSWGFVMFPLIDIDKPKGELTLKGN